MPQGFAGESVPGLVSVVIATYNSAQYVGLAIESVLAQTYQNLEVHVIDDGSTDGTRETVAPYLEDSRVRYHYQENGGQTLAKNHGIRKSRGEFVAFCDADDYWLPDKLALQIPEFAGRERLGVVYTGIRLIDEKGQRLTTRNTAIRHVSGRVTGELFKFNFVPFGTAVVRRRCLEELGSFDEKYRMGIDWDLWLRISTQYEFLFVDRETYVYRCWPGQMSGNWRGRYEHAFRIMRDFLARYPDAVDASTVKEAWADSYTQRAKSRALGSAEYGPALSDLARALRVHPVCRIAWKTLAVVLLAAVGIRR